MSKKCKQMQDLIVENITGVAAKLNKVMHILMVSSVNYFLNHNIYWQLPLPELDLFGQWLFVQLDGKRVFIFTSLKYIQILTFLLVTL